MTLLLRVLLHVFAINSGACRNLRFGAVYDYVARGKLTDYAPHRAKTVHVHASDITHSNEKNAPEEPCSTLQLRFFFSHRACCLHPPARRATSTFARSEPNRQPADATLDCSIKRAVCRTRSCSRTRKLSVASAAVTTRCRELPVTVAQRQHPPRLQSGASSRNVAPRNGMQ